MQLNLTLFTTFPCDIVCSRHIVICCLWKLFVLADTKFICFDLTASISSFCPHFSVIPCPATIAEDQDELTLSLNLFPLNFAPFKEKKSVS